jgi:hypothetical protein
LASATKHVVFRSNEICVDGRFVWDDVAYRIVAALPDAYRHSARSETAIRGGGEARSEPRGVPAPEAANLSSSGVAARHARMPNDPDTSSPPRAAGTRIETAFDKVA